MKQPPLPNASNHVENGILVHLHVNVPLVASLVVEQIHRHVAAIAGQLADVLEVRLDQTVHHLLVSASLRRLARLCLRVQALHRLLRQQTTPHSPRAASLQEVLELLPHLQHLLHRHRVQVPLRARRSRRDPSRTPACGGSASRPPPRAGSAGSRRCAGR